jgi:hypothetical protein
MAIIKITSQGFPQPIELDSNWVSATPYGMLHMESGTTEGLPNPYHLYPWGTIISVDGPGLEMTAIGISLPE